MTGPTTSHHPLSPRRPGGLHLKLPSQHPGQQNYVGTNTEELPPLAALFLIHFDTKKGYTITWNKTSSDDVDLDGVEFKSLPSGLHTLKEDLVYFVHGTEYAGISAFLNVAAGMEERGALMIGVGVLVPLSYGRLGRCWRHAEGLKELARKFTADTSLYTPFEEYYEKHKIEAFNQATPKPHSPVDSTRQHHRTRSVSETGTYLVPGQTLSKSHPALSLGEFMNTFGPLIFPIYRAALARKRILIVTHAPVELACNFVYDISILSNIPLAVTDLLPIEPSRLKPLFNVGVHDIPLLEEEAKIRSTTMGNSEMYRERGAWVACTTDEVLAFKKDLWDVIIHMPPPHARQAKDNVWPTLKTNDGTPVKATQRDLRRYRALKCSLRRRYQRKQSLFLDTEEGLNDMNGGSPTGGSPPPTNRPSSGYGEYDDDSDELNNIEEVCEKLTWREIAYSSFIWWASAGEKRSDPEAEDGRLLLETSVSYTPGNTGFGAGEPFESCSSGESGEDMDMEPPTESSSRDQHHQFGPIISSVTTSSTPPNPGDASGGATTTRRRRRPSTSRRHSTTLRQEGVGSEEMDLIAYFHRFTQRIFSVLAESIATAETADSDEDEGDDEEERLLQRSGSSGSPSERGAIFVNLDDVERMGLDRYSEPDAQVIVGIVERWWGAQREVNVERGRIGCCGIECG